MRKKDRCDVFVNHVYESDFVEDIVPFRVSHSMLHVSLFFALGSAHWCFLTHIVLYRDACNSLTFLPEDDV